MTSALPEDKRRALDDRFMRKVDQSGPTQPHMDTPCWLWTACTHRIGYGTFRMNGKVVGAHRVSYFLFVEETSHDKDVLHRCDVRNCVNPDHLFLGTHAENMKDRDDKQRLARGETNGKSKLSEALVLEIRARHAGGTSCARMAAEYGFADATIEAAATRRSWKHVA